MFWNVSLEQSTLNGPAFVNHMKHYGFAGGPLESPKNPQRLLWWNSHKAFTGVEVAWEGPNSSSTACVPRHTVARL